MIAQQKGRILPFHNCAFAEALSKLHLALFFSTLRISHLILHLI
jgi:hypothetical protein